MQIRDLKSQFISALNSIYDEAEIDSFFYLILEQWHGKSRLDLALDPNFEISPEQLASWETIKMKLQQEVPIQYLLGNAHFYGFQFQVNENVLIPRQETEELIDWVVTTTENISGLTVLDIGTGSGCIAISLAKSLQNAKVSAMDISEEALKVAQSNASRLGVTVNFIQQNVLELNQFEQKYDLIISNPPYVRDLEKFEIKKNVLAHEPHLALFVTDDNALIFYKKIGELAFQNLSTAGNLFFEINQYLGIETVDLLKNIGFTSVELRKDIYGNDRMIRARL